jgi:iron(III) transport system permease protein
MSTNTRTTAVRPPSKGTSPRAAQGRGSRPGPRAVVVLCALIAAFSLLPLGYVVVMTANAGWSTIVALVFRPYVGELLFNTVALVVITVPLCVLLGVGGAWLVERTR